MNIQHAMSFDLAKILQSKRVFRQRLAARSIEEKLAMLDALRERTLALRLSGPAAGAGTLHEEPPPYRVQPKKSG
jgi:hypothetical protein